jgi:HK97 family phage prohead protease
MIRLTAQQITLDASADGQPTRQITGLAVPWNVKATLSGGESVIFLEGSLPEDGPMPKLLEYHDDTRVIGRVTERVSTSEGMMFVAKLSATRAADDALVLLADGALDSVSVGAIPTKFKRLSDGTLEVSQARFVELSVVTQPAYADAQIFSVAASSADESEPDETETPTQTTPTPSEEDETMSEPTTVEAAIATQPIYATAVKRDAKLPTAVEYLSAAIAGGTAWERMHEALRAAAPDVVTSDTPGVLPTPILGPVYNNFIGRRPVVDAIGAKSMPGGGKVFIRPEVTTHTSIGASLAEMANQSGTFVVSSNQVTKQIFGGYVNISEADLDWTDPAILSLLLDDMGRIYANATDNYAADTLRAGASVTQNFTGTATTDPAAWAAWVGNAAGTILSSSNGNLPTHMFVDTEVWKVLLSLSDTADRPLFPQVGPMNAFGNLSPGQYNGNAFGLSVVVDRNFASDTLIVADASGFEVFEQQKGAISLDNPSTLSRTIAFRGYFAALMIDQTKFVRATFV